MRYLLIIFSCLIVSVSMAQNSLTLEQCEELFQKNNLTILAEQYNIDASKAAVIQAKVWQHPYFSGEINALNPQNKRAFDDGKSGEKIFTVQQLIYLGGKKKKEVDFAKSNVDIAELQYEQLLRNLKFELQKSFFAVYFDQQEAKSINAQTGQLDTLISAYSSQVTKGNVSLKDLVRLQSLSLMLKNEMLDIQKNIFAEQENLKLFTNTSENIDALVTEANAEKKFSSAPLYSETQLQEKALEKNPEYLTQLKVMESNDLMLRWQKSLGTPDLTLGASYDQRGGAFQNQVNLTFGIPLPLWNQNKGNVKMATAQVEQGKLYKDQKMAEIKNKISTAYNTLIYQQNQYNQTISSFENLEIVYKGVLKNFQERNITLIEFTDFMESYNQSILFMNEIKKQVIISGETLNYLSNEIVF